MKHASQYQLFANGEKLEHIWHRSLVRFLNWIVYDEHWNNNLLVVTAGSLIQRVKLFQVQLKAFHNCLLANANAGGYVIHRNTLQFELMRNRMNYFW